MVTSFDTLGTPPLAEAIDRHPLIVAPDARLSDVAALMHDTANLAYSSAQQSISKKSIDSLWGARSSCVLVMQDQQLLGIFTERDLVQLTALSVSMQSTCIADVMHYPVLSMTESALHNVFAALFLFRRHQIRHLAIVNEPNQLVGIVSLDSIRHILRPTNLLKIRRVAEVMTRQVISASPTTPVLQLTELMANHHISCVVIVEAFNAESDCHPVGIVTERDIVHFQALGMDMQNTQAQAVMSTPLFVLSPEDSLWTAHQEMEQRQVRRLVVSWNWGKNLGIITQTSLLRVFDPIEMHDVIETLQRTIQQLGLDPNKVLASIDHDTELPAPMCLLDRGELPNIYEFLKVFQTQIEHLVNTPDLAFGDRQAVLSAVLSELQQVQHSLSSKADLS
jgi:signal-transduction protein with cAMP-binding, CBS, and nucleotidyltransferase domain